MKNWHPGPGREKLLYSVENFQIGWWKVQKFTCCPAEWISASVFPRWTRYSPRIRTRLGGLIRWEEKKKKWKKRGRRGIFARVPFPLTSLREKKSPTRLFKYRIAVKKEIYLTLAFLFGRPLYRDPIISYFVAIILIFNGLTIRQWKISFFFFWEVEKKRKETRCKPVCGNKTWRSCWR